MIEVRGNLWEYPADVRCITTNGTIKKNGECVMGRGCAFEARKKIPGIALLLGADIQKNGNHVGWLWGGNLGEMLLRFPVKHNWFEKADIELIKRSADELATWCYDKPNIKTVLLPRPGCGNGGLNWYAEVKPAIENYLWSDKFHVITF